MSSTFSSQFLHTVIQTDFPIVTVLSPVIYYPYIHSTAPFPLEEDCPWSSLTGKMY